MEMIFDILDFVNFFMVRTYGEWALIGFTLLGILSLLRFLLVRGWRV